MTELGKKIIVCMFLNQILTMIPDLKDRIADVTGQAPESLSIDGINLDTIPAAAIGVVWHVISGIVDPRILLALGVAAVAIYYWYVLTGGDEEEEEFFTLEDADMFTEEEIQTFTYEVSRKLLE